MIQLYGASGHGKVVAEILRSNGIDELCFLDDSIKSETSLLSIPILPSSEFDPNKILILTIGANLTRRILAKKLHMANFGNAIHPSAIISKSAEIGRGTVIMPNSVVNSSSFIGNHVIINTAANIDHDCIIEDYAHICPNSALAGNVTVGEGTQIGIGSQVIQGVKIGKWCTIGAGSVIIKDVPDYATVVGNPARIIKVNKQHE